MKYILPKGFVSVDCCSLTVGETTADGFSVYLIPETPCRPHPCDYCTTPCHPHLWQVNIEVETQTQAIVNTVLLLLLHQG